MINVIADPNCPTGTMYLVSPVRFTTYFSQDDGKIILTVEPFEEWAKRCTKITGIKIDNGHSET